MDRDSVVRTIELLDHGATYRATYYVEHGTLHADVAGMRQSIVCMGAPAEEMVRALLAERIMQLTAKPSSSSR